MSLMITVDIHTHTHTYIYIYFADSNYRLTTERKL